MNTNSNPTAQDVLAALRTRRTWKIVATSTLGLALLGGTVAAGVDVLTGQDAAAADTGTLEHPGGGPVDDAVQVAARTFDGAATGTTALVDADDIELTGSVLEQASAAALDAAGEGTVSAAEVSDERGHSYEVEVARADGRTTDVALDADFQVVEVEGWHS